MVKIVFIAGGTAGHLFPALATMSHLQDNGYECHLLTDQRCAHYLKSYPKISYSIIQAQSFSGSIYKKIIALCYSLCGIMKSYLFLRKYKASCAIAFGGYTMFAPSIACKLLNIKLLIHEQNIVLGQANLFFANYAYKIALGMAQVQNLPLTLAHKTIYVGNPIRKDIILLNDYAIRAVAQMFHILIIGGSQGAKIFDDIIPQAIGKVIASLPHVKLKVTQQTSQERANELMQYYEDLKIEHNIQPFFERINDEYNEATIIISRSGASTLSEIITTGLPSILIPLPSSAHNHQRLQAEHLAQQKAAICVLQDTNIVDTLSRQISLLVEDRNLLLEYHSNIMKLRIDGRKNLANLLLEH
jgi:UDP-N-acetylglucosamine--N-acetylmuramyl-(pentapeptide) pyrophosphoryl-undecaprenol N-acetylglucosamine transferase